MPQSHSRSFESQAISNPYILTVGEFGAAESSIGITPPFDPFEDLLVGHFLDEGSSIEYRGTSAAATTLRYSLAGEDLVQPERTIRVLASSILADLDRQANPEIGSRQRTTMMKETHLSTDRTNHRR